MPGGGFEKQQELQNSGGVLAPVKKKKDKFEKAAELQAIAALEGAGVESDFLQQAINQIQGFGGFNPFMEAGQTALSGLQEGSTIGGFGNRLNQIMQGDAFSGLVDERENAVLAGLGAGGLTRSGESVDQFAAIPLDVAMMLENQLTGRQSGLANLGFSGAQGQSGLSGLIASLLSNQGAIEAGGITGEAEALASGILGKHAFQLQRNQARDQNKSDLFGVLGGALGSSVGGPLGGSIGSAIGGAFSDPRLKTNVRKEGKIGKLDLIRWDWIDAVKDTIVAECRTIGFMSTQVRELYPDCVGEYGGYDVVDYPKLVRRLECPS